MVTLESEQPESLIFAVVDFWKVNRATHRGGEFVVRKRVDARQLLEPGAMDQFLLDVTVFGRPVPPVSPRLEHGRKQAAGGVANSAGMPVVKSLTSWSASIVVEVTWLVEP